jgi:hypothetical protein
MATPNPYPDGQDRRPRTSERVRRTMFNVVAVGAIAAAPVATVSLWLLLTNPALASEVADSGSILPVARVLLVTIGKAIAAVLAYL